MPSFAATIRGVLNRTREIKHFKEHAGQKYQSTHKQTQTDRRTDTLINVTRLKKKEHRHLKFLPAVLLVSKARRRGNKKL